MVFFLNKKVLVLMFNTSTEAACLKLIFTTVLQTIHTFLFRFRTAILNLQSAYPEIQ